MPTRMQSDPLLAMKVIPPRLRRGWLPRDRLNSRFDSLADCAVTTIQAPAGFGKTSTLADLRLRALGRGGYAAWLTLDERDDPDRFTESLLLSIGTALGQPRWLDELRREFHAGIEVPEILARLLAQLADRARPVTLAFDDAQTVPEITACETLPYLAINLPPNVRMLVGTRSPLPFPVDDLRADGEHCVLTQEELRFRPEESIQLIDARFGGRVDADTAVRLHQAVDGWPMGLQLVLAAVERDRDPVAALAVLSQRQFPSQAGVADAMLRSLPDDILQFLVEVAALDRLHPALCERVTGRPDAAQLLARLHGDTPLLHAAAEGDWYRMHAVCRRSLLARFEALGPERRHDLQWRAAQWLREQQLLGEAAAQAIASGHEATAMEWIAEGLHEMAMHGRVRSVITAAEGIDPAQVASRPLLCLAMAISYAVSYRHEEARRCLALLAPEALAPDLRAEATQVRGVIANFSDDFDTLSRLADELGGPSARDTGLVRSAHLDLRASLLLQRGDTAAARYELEQHGPPDSGGTLDLAQCYVQFFRAYADYLDGRAHAAELHLAPYVGPAEARFGRRSPLASLLATLHAAILWDQDQVRAAEAVLADRLDVVERTGSPVAVSLAFQTLIRAAFLRGNTSRAHELVDRLRHLGERRHLPRLVVTGLTEQARIEAARGDEKSCGTTVARLHAFRVAGAAAEDHVLRRALDVADALAVARLALCGRDAAAASAALARARELTRPPWPRRDLLELRVLECVQHGPRGDAGEAQLRDLEREAGTGGLNRLLADAWHAASAPVEKRSAREPGPGPAGRSPERPQPATAGQRSVLLTKTESRVLALLARNYTNKEIARALDIGSETVKWHVGNLSTKLHAGGRRHVVERARLLGVLESTG